MSEYKDTLNLPKTAFPMKASLAQREPARLKQWQEMDLYGRIRNASAGRPKSSDKDWRNTALEVVDYALPLVSRRFACQELS